MILNKNTFGKTPAAIYLVDVLNQKNDIGLNKKISRFLVSKKNLLNELVKSNNQGFLSAKNLSGLLLNIRKDVQFDSSEELINNLVNNVVIGDIKDALRKSQVIRKIEGQQTRFKNVSPEKYKEMKSTVVNKEGYVLAEKENNELVLNKHKLEDIKETVTVDMLNAKWEQRMTRRNKMGR